MINTFIFQHLFTQCLGTTAQSKKECCIQVAEMPLWNPLKLMEFKL